MDRDEVLRIAAGVIMDGRCDWSVWVERGDDHDEPNTVWATVYSNRNPDDVVEEFYSAGEWAAALRATATARGWAAAAVNDVLGDALNSGDGSYRP
jgi:hypothetical protein